MMSDNIEKVLAATFTAKTKIPSIGIVRSSDDRFGHRKAAESRNIATIIDTLQAQGSDGAVSSVIVNSDEFYDEVKSTLTVIHPESIPKITRYADMIEKAVREKEGSLWSEKDTEYVNKILRKWFDSVKFYISAGE